MVSICVPPCGYGTGCASTTSGDIDDDGSIDGRGGNAARECNAKDALTRRDEGVFEVHGTANGACDGDVAKGSGGGSGRGNGEAAEISPAIGYAGKGGSRGACGEGVGCGEVWW